MGHPSFASLSFAYPAVPLPRREAIADALSAWDSPDVFVFSTCLRVEVAGPVTDSDLVDRFERVAPGGVSEGKLRSGADAIEHVFSVVAGLQSPIRGEHEVLTQFRAQVVRSGLTPPLRRMVERAVSVGRDVRRHVEAPRGSLARIAVDRIGDVDHMAVVGGGEMARSVIEVVSERRPGTSITMVLRQPENVLPPDGVEVLGMDSLRRVLGSFPVVVSATSTSGRLVSERDVERSLADRDTELLLIDLAMPPDFDRPQAANLTYLTVDDLADRITAVTPDDDLDLMVAGAARETWRAHAHADEVGPVIGSLFAVVDEVVESTVNRFSGRLREDGDTEVLRQAVHTAVRKMLAKPVDHIHTSTSPAETAASVEAIFDLHGEKRVVDEAQS
ncbi:MAG: hypothetical protein GEU79_08340 [Acidimicrobiia bacterium]|nr:hypothetical protein [Acidimicrobiia bacterium]